MNYHPRLATSSPPWISAHDAGQLATMRLAYALRAFLETCEEQFCPQWPLRTPGVPRHLAVAAAEYRRDRDGDWR